MGFNKNEKQQKSPAKRFLFVFGLVSIVVYLALAVCIIFWEKLPIAKIFVIDMSPARRWGFALLLAGYSFFRFYRLQQTQDQ